MNRKHTGQSYIDLIARIRAERPDIALSGDFIVGFPGETEEDFQATMDLVEHVTYAQAYSFKYSARPGTPAADRQEVPEDVKSERLARLQALLTTQQRSFQESMVGKTMPVLFEKTGRKDGQLIGKSPYLQAVHVTAPLEFIGTIKDVKIQASVTNSLSGELL